MIPDHWKKEAGAMRIRVVLVVITIFLTSCTHLNIKKNVDTLKQIQPGDSDSLVFKQMGPPDLRIDFTKERFVAYYQTRQGATSSAPVTADLCTPISFENSQVVVVGDDLIASWTQQEESQKRQAEMAEQERKRVETMQAARKRAEAERQAKIAKLEEEVAPVAASDAALNLKLYNQLRDLDPDNTRYQKKVAFYEDRLVQQKKARQARLRRVAKEKRRREWDKGREARNKKLRQYTGNGIAEMAVHDMGNGSLYVWVKNMSKQIITTHPDHFTLIDSNKHKAKCAISDSLDSVLEPGSISHGKIEYNKEIEPKTLIFKNRESGEISKRFQ